MSRTRKDSWIVAHQDLEVVKREDDTYDFFRYGVLKCHQISERTLSEELARYGYCGSEFEEIVQEVEAKGSKLIPL